MQTEQPQTQVQAPVPTGQSLIQQIKAANPTQLVNMPAVVQKFKHLYKAFNRQDEAMAQIVYEQEKFNFLKVVTSNPTLSKCEPMSLYGCFMDAAVNGLSFDPTKKHVYLVPYSNKATLMISPYGELLTRMRAGQIRYADNPILVYEGDEFSFSVSGGVTSVDYKMNLPRKEGAPIIGCFICITRPDGSLDYKVLSLEEVMKFRKFSKSANSLAWTDGLPGMIQAKTIKHAFKSYPKIPLQGSFSQLVSEKVEDIEHQEVIDYGLDGAEVDDQQDFTPHEDVKEDAQAEQQPATNTNPQNLQQVKPDNPQAGMAQAAANVRQAPKLDF